MTPRVVRNDWAGVDVPELGRWQPTRSVSVVIPAYGGQSTLDLTLAALSRQTYPASRLEVVVVDDGSRPPLRLPPLRPEHCRLLPAGASGWGRAHALAAGAAASDGEVIHWLDADMVVFPEHVEAQARWHHVVPYAVTLGDKRFVDPVPPPTPEAAAAAAETLFAGGEPHDHVEATYRRTDRLRAGDHLVFMVHVGATAALTREMYRAAGGLDPALRLGEDTEFGYRLAQAGAVFVPVPEARAWHLGRTHMSREPDRLRRYNRPFLADRMPQPRWLRRVGGSAWAVPLVVVVVDARGHPLETVRASVDAILANDERDLRVELIGDWESSGDGRVDVLADPALEARLVAATYRSDPRVRLTGAAPDTAFPSPYLLTVPVTCGLARTAVRRLVEAADGRRAGVVRVPVGERFVELWRTAALGRAGWVRRAGEPLLDAVTEVHGSCTVPPDAIGIVDLSPYPPDRLAGGIGAAAEGIRPRRGITPASVEVSGARSLARAAALVGRLSVARMGRRLRRRSAR